MSTILVTGATGKQGGAIIAALLALPKPPITIHVLTRFPKSPSAVDLASKSSTITLVEGSFDTLSSALSNVDAAFFMSENVTGGASNEVAQGRAISSALASVRDSGEKVPHVVYSSVDGAERGTGIPHFESKWEIEKLLRRVVGAEGMTVLRPVAFMNNFPKRSGEALSPLWGAFDVVVGGKKLQWVSTSDIGHFGALALTNPGEWAGKTVGIAGENLSISDIQDTYLKVQGFRPTRPTMDLEEAVTKLPPPLRATLEWIAGGGGYAVDIEKLRVEYPGLQTFEAYLRS